MKTVDMFNEALVIFSLVADCCTPACCPTMSAGRRYEYQWQDPASNEYRRPLRVPARQYVELLMQWIERHIDDEAIFPTEPGAPFPADFDTIVCNIFRRLFRVYAHIYYMHMERVHSIDMEPHLNTAFKHFIYTALEFGLIPEREREPLMEKIGLLQREDDAKFSRRASQEEPGADATSSTPPALRPPREVLAPVPAVPNY